MVFILAAGRVHAVKSAFSPHGVSALMIIESGTDSRNFLLATRDRRRSAPDAAASQERDNGPCFCLSPAAHTFTSTEFMTAPRSDMLKFVYSDAVAFAL
jgi:hypothetical protein